MSRFMRIAFIYLASLAALIGVGVSGTQSRPDAKGPEREWPNRIGTFDRYAVVMCDNPSCERYHHTDLYLNRYVFMGCPICFEDWTLTTPFFDQTEALRSRTLAYIDESSKQRYVLNVSIFESDSFLFFAQAPLSGFLDAGYKPIPADADSLPELVDPIGAFKWRQYEHKGSDPLTGLYATNITILSWYGAGDQKAASRWRYLAEACSTRLAQAQASGFRLTLVWADTSIGREQLTADMLFLMEHLDQYAK